MGGANAGGTGCWNAGREVDAVLDSRGAVLVGMIATRSNREAFAIIVGRRRAI
jgi:hypothetical protein